jgi:hypothetical protein
MFFADLIILGRTCTTQVHHEQTLYYFLKNKSSTLLFTHTGPFDKNGYLYYIATERLTVPWQNPSRTGKILASAKSLNPESTFANIDNITCNPKPGTFYTDYNETKDAWIKIDLLDNPRIIPNFYSLHSAQTGGLCALRNWQLQGSNDDVIWTVLVDHKNDILLHNHSLCPGSWPITSNVPYRYFRLYANTNQQNTRGVLMSMGGIEIYGTVFLK